MCPLRVPIRSRFFFTATPTPEIYTLSLHDALPIYLHHAGLGGDAGAPGPQAPPRHAAAEEVGRDRLRSEEHTSELQSHVNLVCRLLLEKKKKTFELDRLAQSPVVCGPHQVGNLGVA